MPQTGQEAVALSARLLEAAEPPEMFERYFDTIYRYFSRRVPSPEDVEDLTAETFFVVLHRKVPRGVDPLCFLFGVARRKLADHYRRKNKDRVLASAETQSPSTDIRIEVLQIQSLMRALPDTQREALMLQTLEQLAVVEIGQIMGRSSKSVKALLQRAKSTIREQMPETEDIELNP